MFRSITQEPKIPVLDKLFRALDTKTHKSLTFKYLVRLEGIEPSCLAWKASVLPLNYSRNPSAP